MVIFESARPQLVMWLGRIMGLKSAVCTGAAGFSAWIYTSALAQQGSAAAAASAAASTGDPRLTGGFLALALVSGYISRAVSNRTVTKLILERPAGRCETASPNDSATDGPTNNADASAKENEASSKKASNRFAQKPEPVKLAIEAQNPDDTIIIHRPKLWSSSDRVLRVRRRDISCARANSTFQGFQLSISDKHGGAIPQYLFPVHGKSRSDDLPYLKTMLFGDFFRDEPPPPPDSELIAIEGFGPYRPAQFADAHHPKFPLHIPVTPQAQEVPGLPFFTQHGTVWAQFSSPPKPTLIERRAMERDEKLYGKQRTPADRLPTIAAPVSLMLDGTHFVHRLTPGQAPVVGAAIDEGAKAGDAAAAEGKAASADAKQ